MSSTVSQAFVEDFESRVYQLGQQEVSRARSCVRNRTGTGDIYNFERLAASDMAAIGSRHGATPINNVAHSRRKASVATFNWGEAVDNADLARILIDPDSEYVMSAGMALGRRWDRSIFSTAVSDTATTDGAGVAVALPAGQVITDASNPLSLDHLRQVKRKLDESEIIGPRYAAISAKGLEDLLTVTEVTSQDFASVKALVNGEINTFMGFTFIRSELVPSAAQSDDNVTAQGALFWVRDALALAISDDRFTRIGEDPSIRFSNRIYLETTFGVARVEDEGVVVVDHAA